MKDTEKLIKKLKHDVVIVFMSKYGTTVDPKTKEIKMESNFSAKEIAAFLHEILGVYGKELLKIHGEMKEPKKHIDLL